MKKENSDIFLKTPFIFHFYTKNRNLHQGSEKAIMQGPRSNIAGPRRDISWPKLMSEGQETHLDNWKANDTMLDCSFILLKISSSEWTLS